MSNKTVIQQVFDALGLNAEWTPLTRIDSGCKFVLDNEHILKSKLPKRCIGELSLLRSDVALIRRKSLLAFARRLAAESEGAIIRKRVQVRIDKKTISRYSYKLLMA